MVNEKLFKRKYKPSICTTNPVKYLIPYRIRYELLRQIKIECIEAYGQDISEECPKRLVCLTKKCTARPLFWESVTALPYLNKLIKNQVVNSDGDLYVDGCDNCKINKICTSPCYQVHDFTKRNYSKEPTIIYKESIENYDAKIERPTSDMPKTEGLEIPWDALPDKKARIVRLYLYQNMDFLQIAKAEGLFNQASAKYQFYSALNILSEVAIMRRFLKLNSDKLLKSQVRLLKLLYVKNLSLTSVAKRFKITKQSCHQRIKRIIDNNGIKFQRFVHKNKGKAIYNIPYLMK